MSAILLNSGGGIHVDNGNILLADPLSPEDCECCGPPQPPPPDCIRCWDGTNYYTPTEYDLALQISTVTDQYKETYRRDFIRPRGSNTIGGPCWNNGHPCTDHAWYLDIELEINGFAGLNGTYYGTTKVNEGGKEQSSLAPFNPFDAVDNPNCLDPICDRFCKKHIWIKDVPLTGYYRCRRYRYWSCWPGTGLKIDVLEDYNIPLTGWAYLRTSGLQNQYGQKLNAPNTGSQPDLIAEVSGSIPATDYQLAKSFYTYMINANSALGISRLDCDTDDLLPEASSYLQYPCPGSGKDLSYYPYWRMPYSTESVACSGNPATSPLTIPFELNQPACSASRSVVNTVFVDPTCGSDDITRSYEYAINAFNAKYDFIWSLA